MVSSKPPPAASTPPRSARRRDSDPFLIWMLSCLVLGFAASSAAAVAAPCLVGGSDAEAREEARTARTIAETYSTDHEGAYSGLSLRALHRVESSVTTSRKAAVREHREAYVYAAIAIGHGSGYIVRTRTFDGNIYAITRRVWGVIAQTDWQCGHHYSW
jgi:hypothetical protein